MPSSHITMQDLPPEILISIVTFNLSRHPEPTMWYKDLARWSRVCWEWYNAIWNTPLFFTIYFSRMPDAILNKMLHHPTQSTFDITLISETAFLANLRSAIAHIPVKRWRSLLIPLTTNVYDLLDEGCSQLTSLWLLSTNFIPLPPNRSAPTNSLPNLRHLIIGDRRRSLTTSWTILPFRGLETLRLIKVEEIRPRWLLSLLQASPELRSLQLDGCGCPFPRNNDNDISNKINMPKLRSLVLTDITPSDLESLHLIMEPLEVRGLEHLKLASSHRHCASIFLDQLPRGIIGSIVSIASRASELKIDVMMGTLRIQAPGLYVDLVPVGFSQLIDDLSNYLPTLPVHLMIDGTEAQSKYSRSLTASWPRDAMHKAMTALRAITHLSLRRLTLNHLHSLLDALQVPDAKTGWPLPNLVHLSVVAAFINLESVLGFLQLRYGSPRPPTALTAFSLHTKEILLSEFIDSVEDILGHGVMTVTSGMKI